MQQGMATASGKGQDCHLVFRGFVKADWGLTRLVLVESGFVLALFPVVKGAVFPHTKLENATMPLLFFPLYL